MNYLLHFWSTVRTGAVAAVRTVLHFTMGNVEDDKVRHAAPSPTDVAENPVRILIRKVGRGPIALGEHTNIWLGEMAQSPGNVLEVALKCLRGKFENDVELKELLHRRILNHIDTCRHLHHPNIARFYDLVVHQASLTLIMPYFSNGGIIHYLKRNPHIPNGVRHGMIKDLVTAVAYLHGRGISHDNIHCDNVLVDENSQVVLCDIGIDSVIRSIDTYCRCHSRYRYRAPELMIPSLVNVTPFTMLMADVWSLGRTVQEILTLRRPFHTINNEYKFLIKLNNGALVDDRPAEISVQIWNMLKNCFAIRPQDRPTAGELVGRFEENL